MSTLALNKLWEYIQVLALSNQNKQWLAQKLIESQTKENDSVNEKEEKLYSMFGAWSDDSDMDIIEEAIKKGRISGTTRHIISLDEA